MSRVIAFIGAAGCGKSTIAVALVKRKSYTRYRFAQPLKAMLQTLGLTPEQIDGKDKMKPSALLCGKTPRHAMQTLGTEWRDMISPLLWTNIMEHQLKAHIGEFEKEGAPALIVIDDCRFPHEVEMLRKLGAEIWCVRRAAVEPGIITRWISRLPRFVRWLATLVLATKPLHPSELHWMDIDADYTVFNNGTEEEFISTVETIIDGLSEKVPADEHG